MSVKIVTDTGCDLPPTLVERYGIELVPLVLRLGDRTMPETEMPREELWRYIEAELPCDTSGPPIGAYEALYAPLVQAGHDIVCITLTGAHSVTYNSAWTAAQAFKGRVTVIDSCSLSVGLGLQVLEAVRLAAQGADAKAIEAALVDIKQRSLLWFFLESFDQIRRGGRLAALMPMLDRLGTALNLRVMLTMSAQGQISLVGPSRGRRGATRRLIREAESRAPLQALGIVHTRRPQEASDLADRLASRLNIEREEIIIAEAGPALIAHAGEGALGVTLVKKA